MSRDPSSPAPGRSELGRTSAWRRIRDFLLRGGRLTKVAGEAASYAPSVGRAAPAALGAFAGLVARASGAGRAAASASMLGILAGTFLALSASEALSHREYRKFLGSDNCHNHPDSVGSNHEEFWCIGPANTPQLVSVSDSAVNLVLGENANQSNIENVFNIYDGSGRALEIVQSGSGGITVTRGPNRRVSMTSYGTVLRAVNRGVGNITISLSNATLRKSKNTDDSVVRIINEDAAGGSVTLNLGTISIGTGGSGAHGNGHGLYITNNGSGTTTISASGHIVGVGRGGDGIRVRGTGSSAASDSISISVATVTGGRAGIDVTHRGGGDVSIRATGAVTGNNGYGIVLGKNGGGSTAITVSGPVTSSRDGIRVNDGVARSAATASLTISVASVTGGWMGMRLEHRGGGNVSIRATGTVTGRGGADEGISVKNFTGDSSVTISAASVVAQGTHDGADAIAVEQKADGDVAVTVSGAVSTAGGRGIFVDNDGDGDVTIVADASGASVSRGGSHRKDAIRVENAGSGAVDISVRGVSAGGSGYHAIAVDSKGRGDVTVTIRGTVTAGAINFSGAPRAVHLDTPSGAAGRITLKSGAVVKGVIEDGGADTELIVESGAKLEQNVILGAGDDTFALNRREDFTGKNVNLGAGTDTLRIDFSIGVHPADFLTDFASSWEILHFSRGGHLRKPWTITRSGVPINVFNKFSFDVPGREGNDGVKLTQTGRSGITFTQSGGFMRANQYPVTALNSGEGDVSITLAGEVKTHDQTGFLGLWRNPNQGLVHAENKDASGGSVWISVGSVQASLVAGKSRKCFDFCAREWPVLWGGHTHAVWAKNQGTGATTVIATGSLRGGSLQGDGVKVETGSRTTSVYVSVKDVFSRNTGVFISHAGSGTISVTASGSILTQNHSFRNDHYVYCQNADCTVAWVRRQKPRGDNGAAITIIARNTESSGSVKVDAATITASAEGILVRSSTQGEISVSATGMIVAGGHGISANADGTSNNAAINISVGSVEASSIGILAYQNRLGNISIKATGAIEAGSHGISAISWNGGSARAPGPSSIAISVATVTGDGGHGLKVSQWASGTVQVIATGDVTGKNFGVRLYQNSIGNVSVHISGSVLGKGGSGGNDSAFGLGTYGHKSVGAINVNLATVTAEGTGAGAHGILVRSSERGDVSVTATGAIATSGGHGIFIDKGRSGSGDVLITATGRITGAKTGIRVTSAGSGTVSVNAAGALTGKGVSDSAFFASLTSLTASSAINVNLATVTAEGTGAGAHGILVRSSARGDVSVTATGAVAASGGHGIFIDKRGTGSGGVSVNTSGNITGDRAGIHLTSSGTGKLSVHAAGKVTAKGAGHGIHVVGGTEGSGQSISVSAPGTVVAEGFKLKKSGIFIVSDNPRSASVTVSAGTVVGEQSGIRVTHRGQGDLVIRATGSVQGLTNPGLLGFHDSGAVYARNWGTGDTSVTVTGGIYGDMRRPVDLGYLLERSPRHGTVDIRNANSSGTSALTLSVGSVTRGGRNIVSGHVIFVKNMGGGPTIVVATGRVSVGVGNRWYGRGIWASTGPSDSAGASLSISVGSVDAQADIAMAADHRGAGDLVIRATGSVHGRGIGIIANAHHPSARSLVAVSAGSVTSRWSHGMEVFRKAGHSAVISATGRVSGAQDGIRARTEAASLTVPGASLTVSVASVTGNWVGMRLVHAGGGGVSVRSSGTVVGRGERNSAVFVETLDSSGTGGVRLDLASVTAEGTLGAAHGVHVRHSGRGDVSISVAGTAKSAGGDAVHASATGSPSSITVSVKDAESASGHGIYVKGSSTSRVHVSAGGRVAGGGSGVRVVRHGVGAVSVRSTGTVTTSGTDASAVWISLSSAANAEAVTLDLASVASEGAGAGAHGIFVSNASDGDVFVAAGTVTSSAGHGIRVLSSGAGGVSVRSTGTVTSSGKDASGVWVSVSSAANAGAVTLDLASVASEGAGAGAHGVFVGDASDGDVFVAAGTVKSSAGHGIRVLSSGGGGVRVSATGAVSASGAGMDGISVETGSGDSSLTVSIGSLASVSGWRSGLRLLHAGGGGVSVRSDGTVAAGASGSSAVWVSVSSATNSGAVALNLATATAGGGADAHAVEVLQSGRGSVSVTSTGLVRSSSGHGIRVVGSGPGSVRVTVSGAVLGDRSGISLEASGSARPAVVSVESGGHVGAEDGVAVSAVGGTTAVVVKPGGWVRGSVSLGGGGDSFAVSGGRFKGAVSLGGGADEMAVTSGTAEGSFIFGAGDDSLTWTGGAIWRGTVDFGAGSDRFDFRPVRVDSFVKVLNLASLRLEAGGIFAPVSLSNSGSAASMTLSSATSVRATEGTALAVSGSGGVWFAQEAGGPSVSGITGAVWATGSDSGGVSVSLAGGASARLGTAVRAEAPPDSGAVAVSVSGAVSARDAGVRVERMGAAGSGATAVTVSGPVAAGTGVWVRSVSTGSLSVAVSSVAGVSFGIDAEHSGTVSLSLSGAVTGGAGIGILIERSGDGDISLAGGTGAEVVDVPISLT